jgi:hypothetical protein
MEFMKSNLIGPPKGKQSVLPAMALKDHLDFTLQERKQPAASPISANKPITERTNTTAPVIQELYGQHCDAYSHWGLNE